MCNITEPFGLCKSWVQISQVLSLYSEFTDLFYLFVEISYFCSTIIKELKSVFNVILAIVVAGIIYLCVSAVLVPIRFNKAKSVRDNIVERQLILIRNTQNEYSKQHLGLYCSSWSELAAFAKEAKLPRTSTDSLHQSDTVWVSLVDSLYPKHFNVDSLKYVPFGRGVTFEIVTKTVDVSRETKMHLLQVQTPYSVYLHGLNSEAIRELENIQSKKKKYAGLKIGDLEHPNGLAGNWEISNKNKP